MRRKFKIKYPKNHEKAGENFKPGNNSMVVMNSDGIFFVVGDISGYATYIDKLSNRLPKYDVEWSDQ